MSNLRWGFASAHGQRRVQPCRCVAFRVVAEVSLRTKHIDMYAIAVRFPCAVASHRGVPTPWSTETTGRQRLFQRERETAVSSWQAEVSLTLTQRNEGARGEAYLSTSVRISMSDWCLPVKWSRGLSDMTLVSLWHTCPRLTVIGVDGPHSTQPARHSYFDPLFFYFCPPSSLFSVSLPHQIRVQRWRQDPQVLAY